MSALLVTFHSVASALLLERLLKERGSRCAIVPVPRQLSTSCGYATETDGVRPDDLAPFMTREKVEWEAIYCREDDYRLVASYPGG